MRVPLRLVSSLVIVIVWDTLVLAGAEPKAASKPSQPQKKAADSAPAETSSTHKVKRELFKVELALKGAFEAAKATEIVLRPEVWQTLEVEKAVEHGQAVKRGDVIVQCDLDKINEEIADARAKLAITELSLKQAEQNLRTLESSTPMDLKLAERSQHYAQEDLARFLRIDRPMSEKMAQFMVKTAENYLEYDREELRQLEKMYKADDLTEETEEIILKRQRNAVEAAETMLQAARVDRDDMLQVEIPRKQEGLEQTRERQDLLAAKAKVTLPMALEQQRRELAKLKLESAKEEQKLKKLSADRDLLTVRAPLDGVVYYGRFVRGKWSGQESVAESLRRGGAIAKNAVLVTIVALRPMTVRATVSEADLGKIRPGLKGIARPAAYPDLRLEATLAGVDPIPTAADAFNARIEVQLGDGDKRAASLVPGMACNVKFAAYLDKRALVVPAKAVFDEELDEDRHYVFLARKEKEPEKRSVIVGKRNDDKVEIVRGLAEGDEVLLERPKDKPAASEPSKEAAKKAAEPSKAKEPAKKKPAADVAKKAESSKKKPQDKEKAAR